jgi:hypothetical protein
MARFLENPTYDGRVFRLNRYTQECVKINY